MPWADYSVSGGVLAEGCELEHENGDELSPSQYAELDNGAHPNPVLESYAADGQRLEDNRDLLASRLRVDGRPSRHRWLWDEVWRALGTDVRTASHGWIVRDRKGRHRRWQYRSIWFFLLYCQCMSIANGKQDLTFVVGTLLPRSRIEVVLTSNLTISRELKIVKS